MKLVCTGCGKTFPGKAILYRCSHCEALLEVRYPEKIITQKRTWKGSGVWRYEPLLPTKPLVTLGEGNTGLHLCKNLSSSPFYVKHEGENPTGSFKDRGMTVGIAWAKKLGATTVACASTGNTSASLAAYAGRAGMRAIVLIPSGNVAMGKIAQALVHGAKVIQIDGNFDDAMRLVQQTDAYLLNSINPFRLEGQKTLAFEVCETLGRAPDTVILPMGNAGNISAIWKGFKEWKAAGRISTLPKMIGVQAAGANPIVRNLRGQNNSCTVAKPDTIATAIRIGAPVNWTKAIAAIRESRGDAVTVTDKEILAAQKLLAQKEGLFVEPASAAPVAHLLKTKRRGKVVCIATGHGLKDPEVILRGSPKWVKIKPDLRALQRVLR